MAKESLTNDTKHHKLNDVQHVIHQKKKRKKRKKRNKERLSEQDIHELMGMHMDKYQRVNGRVKRK